MANFKFLYINSFQKEREYFLGEIKIIVYKETLS